ncbi:hypothetical protein BURPSPAST_AA0765 [Burkholderia pseudomallei Pasteur 52237]|nr:hypothetical protein BURPSPAST_AA0765 [Burkholderia pseudomallei Pasteur 52237]
MFHQNQSPIAPPRKSRDVIAQYAPDPERKSVRSPNRAGIGVIRNFTHVHIGLS